MSVISVIRVMRAMPNVGVARLTLAVMLTLTSTLSLADDLKTSVLSRWKALEAHDFELAYEFQTPKYKAVFPVELYLQRFGSDIRWRLTKLESIKYDSDGSQADVITLVETRRNSDESPLGANIVDVKLTEKWLHINGKWWHSSYE